MWSCRIPRPNERAGERLTRLAAVLPHAISPRHVDRHRVAKTVAGLVSAASRATVPRSGRRKRENLRPCLGSDTSCAMEPATSKPIHFLGDSREALRDFPDDARYSAGTELRAVQTGLDPSDWKPIKTVGAGVREIRIREASGAFRVIYLATLPDRALVLHAFQKKTQQTPQKDIDLAAKRLKTWKAEQ